MSFPKYPAYKDSGMEWLGEVTLLPKRVLDTVIDVMTDNEKLSLEVLDNEAKSRAFTLMVLKMVKQWI